MAIQLPRLPFGYTDLEPQISEDTLKFHYDHHHAGYVEKLNSLIKNTPYDKMMLEEIIVEAAQNPADRKIFNFAAQAWNHSFYWNCLSPNANPEPSVSFQKTISQNFGSFKQFLDAWTKSCEELFGSGWVWLVKDSDEKLSILPMENAENPILLGKTPLLVCDIWEHAYYLDHQHNRNHYVKAFSKLINWDFVESNFHKSSNAYNATQKQQSAGLYH